ncbi:MAG: GNAT family N-acetyltransferase [Caldilineaceae bacterium]
MQLSIQPINRNFAIQICNWRYEPPYDIYNWGSPPDEETLRYILDPAFAFHAIVDAEGELAGFCSFGKDGQVPGGDYGLDALDIGMGVRPDLTGRRLGAIFATAVTDFAIGQYAPARLRVTIARFNKRAMRVWEKIGFKKVAEFQSTKQRPF